MKGLPLLLWRKIARTIELQESIGKGFPKDVFTPKKAGSNFKKTTHIPKRADMQAKQDDQCGGYNPFPKCMKEPLQQSEGVTPDSRRQKEHSECRWLL
ncbi:hypothetical protein STEG23_024891 [Scotinomys teguina]